MKQKTIIFFDGDGTIWYPRETKRRQVPYWIYYDKKIGENYLEYLTVIPNVVNTLKKLRKEGYFLVLLSTHPYSVKESDIRLGEKVKYLKLESLFDELHTARDRKEGKGEKIVAILKEKHIFKSRALMIGDSYRYDYLSAKKVGVDALLIKSDYMKHPLRGGKVKNTVKGVEDLIKILSSR